MNNRIEKSIFSKRSLLKTRKQFSKKEKRKRMNWFQFGEDSLLVEKRREFGLFRKEELDFVSFHLAFLFF